MSTNLNLVVCLIPSVTALDYQGPVELFGFLNPEHLELFFPTVKPSHTISISYLSHTLDPVIPLSGPAILPQGTYEDALKNKTQYDIVFIPGGGPDAIPEKVPDVVLDFIKQQAPGCQYILSVCTGSWVLSGTGLLDGRKATTNKASFTQVKAATSDKIEWVAKARWVVDGNIWTSSGVTAGMDMANAFLLQLVGEDTTKVIQSTCELVAHEQGDDEFAAVFGLV